MNTDLAAEMADFFGLKGSDIKAEKLGSGHIHRTYRLSSDYDSLVVQRINTEVFKDLAGLLENLKRIEAHCEKREAGFAAHQMTWLQSASDHLFKEEGYYWRAFKEVPDTLSLDVVSDEDIAYQGAHGFGVFLNNLADLRTQNLVETIPGFHHAELRLSQFKTALGKAKNVRIKASENEISFVNDHYSLLLKLMDAQKSGFIPIRIAHNDTKISNILFDKKSKKARCVIDLDTVMPGTWLYDYGDMVRTFCNPLPEDHPHTEEIAINLRALEALQQGFLDALGREISPQERELLPLGGQYMCLIIGLRFLTDYLNGDKYFPIDYDDHNLVRARNQFQLVKSMR